MIRVIFVHSCDGCGSTDVETCEMFWGSEPMRPGLPEFWRRIDGRSFCGKHQVSLRLTVDGITKDLTNDLYA